jgi:hypothetical protein
MLPLAVTNTCNKVAESFIGECFNNFVPVNAKKYGLILVLLKRRLIILNQLTFLVDKFQLIIVNVSSYSS